MLAFLLVGLIKHEIRRQSEGLMPDEAGLPSRSRRESTPGVSCVTARTLPSHPPRTRKSCSRAHVHSRASFLGTTSAAPACHRGLLPFAICAFDALYSGINPGFNFVGLLFWCASSAQKNVGEIRVRARACALRFGANSARAKGQLVHPKRRPFQLPGSHNSCSAKIACTRDAGRIRTRSSKGT
jgi:hypothetical protein